MNWPYDSTGCDGVAGDLGDRLQVDSALGQSRDQRAPTAV
jgi:hypothetical protein